jgi:hypothetical protein
MDRHVFELFSISVDIQVQVHVSREATRTMTNEEKQVSDQDRIECDEKCEEFRNRDLKEIVSKSSSP